MNFMYERLSTFCFVCGVLGHFERDCTMVYENPDKEVEKAYDSWMWAPTRNSQVNTGARWLRNLAMENSSAKGYVESSKFRTTDNYKAEIEANFVENGGVLREKGDIESGITIINRNQEDMDVIEQLPVGGKAGEFEMLKQKDKIIVESKRKRVEDNMEHEIGPSLMITDGLINNMEDIHKIDKLGDNSKNLFVAGSAEQARQAQ